MTSGAFSFTTNTYARPDGTLLHDTAKSHHMVGTSDFVAVDGEGETYADGHRYVLLGVGQDQIEDPSGLHWSDIFSFLYGFYHPRTAFVGFFLGYDFTQWLKTLPESRARALLTIEGREGRRSKSAVMHGRFLPVDIDGWQVDMLGSKRMAIRTKPCDCLTVKCPHDKGPWMHICDAGGFFQTSFLNVINPANWQEPIVSDDEYALIERGKEHRSDAKLDDDMRMYNRLENEILERVMRNLDDGFKHLEVNLSPKQWFGPGQAAQSWMRGRAPTRKDIEARVPAEFLDAARQSYFGGWFELQAHGIIPGASWEYDINSAYPAIIAALPCLLHGTYSSGTGRPPDTLPGEICLVRALVWGRAPHSDRTRKNAIGAMLHRDRQGRISRPLITEGWFWLHELEAAQRAGCIKRVNGDRYFEWHKYTPCECPAPLRQVANLYKMRLDVGKDSILGKAAKLLYNSMYGKTAQSVGSPLFANPVYASLITAGCRTMILDAIATHPGGKSNVLMIATDAVFFIDPHTLLVDSERLGGWSSKRRDNLTLFKPGVYWDDKARQQIADAEHPSFKARGVSARDFASSIATIDAAFAAWGSDPPSISSVQFTPEELAGMGLPSWPRVKYTSSFAMTSCLQALVRGDWDTAGAVNGAKEMVQNANPEDKRTDIWRDDSIPGRIIYRSEPHEVGRNAAYRHVGNMSEWNRINDETYASVPYEKRFGLEDPFSDENTQAFGISPDEHRPYLGMFRVLTGQE